MGKKWDDLRTAQEMQKWHEGWLRECFRALRPGGVIKAFSATRTHHRLAAAMLNVGFVLNPKNSLEAWMFGSGFPKSLNVSKALDAQAGAEREVVGKDPNYHSEGKCTGQHGFKVKEEGQGQVYKPPPGVITAPVTPEAQLFDGYGTALKPAWEIFLVGRKEG